MEDTIVVIYIILCIVFLIIYIWLICIFVRMTWNVSDIRSLLIKYINSKSETKSVSRKDARLAVILHREDECYEQIVTRLFEKLTTAHQEQTEHIPPTVDTDKVIATAASICAILGRNLPPELSSYEAFQAFCKLS